MALIYMGAEIIIADGRSSVGDVAIKSAYEAIINQTTRCAEGQAARRLVISNGFVREENTSGYYLELNPGAGLCTDIMVPNAFAGHIAVLRGKIADLEHSCGRLDKPETQEFLARELQWACPLESKTAGPGIEVIFGTKAADATLWSKLPSMLDAVAWDAAIDNAGFVGIFTDSKEFLLAVCCRSTAASRWVYDRLHKGDSPTLGKKATYRDLISCAAYARAVELGERNVLRMLYRTATAIGMSIRGFPDAKSVVSQVRIPKSGTREELLVALTPVPLVASPDYGNMLDMFVDAGDYIQYFNAVSPTTGPTVTGGFVSAIEGNVSDHGLSIHPLTPELSARPYFDGCIFMTPKKFPNVPIPFAKDLPHSDYVPLLTIGGSERHT